MLIKFKVLGNFNISQNLNSINQGELIAFFFCWLGDTLVGIVAHLLTRPTPLLLVPGLDRLLEKLVQPQLQLADILLY